DDHHDVRRRRAGGPSPVRALASASRAERRDRRVAGVRMARRQIAGGRRGPDFQIAVFRRGVGGANRPVERLYFIAGGARTRGQPSHHGDPDEREPAALRVSGAVRPGGTPSPSPPSPPTHGTSRQDSINSGRYPK